MLNNYYYDSMNHIFYVWLSAVSVDMADRPRPQVTKLMSGDDLEDDFVMDDKSTAKKNTIVDPSEPENSKKKQGTKVVNFVG